MNVGTRRIACIYPSSFCFFLVGLYTPICLWVHCIQRSQADRGRRMNAALKLDAVGYKALMSWLERCCAAPDEFMVGRWTTI